MSSPANDNTERLTGFQIIILFLSLYVLIGLAVTTFFPVSEDMARLLYLIDDVVCLVFLSDFGFRLYKADNKLHFLKWSWIDLVSSIPTLDYLRWGRIVRVFRIFRLLRGFRSLKTLLAFLFRNKAQGAFTTALLAAATFLIFGSVAILDLESHHPDANIVTAGDAIWWSLVTITTVGYGDYYPVTLEGRIVAAFLMIAGIGLFGTISGAVASVLLGPTEETERDKVEKLDNLTRILLEKLEQRDWGKKE
ncbi:MAG: ion transporter [Gemmataceae bacterium]